MTTATAVPARSMWSRIFSHGPAAPKVQPASPRPASPSLPDLPGQRSWFAPEVLSSVPHSLLLSPVDYIQEYGRQIKPGHSVVIENGVVKEDPMATLDLPSWSQAPGAPGVVVKRVNRQKAQVFKRSDPFYELKIMRAANALGLPSARALGHITTPRETFIFMECAPGMRLLAAELAALASRLSPVDRSRFEAALKREIASLSERYDAIGIRRQWHLKDMVVDFDEATLRIHSVVPVDWERAKVDWTKVKKAVASRPQARRPRPV